MQIVSTDLHNFAEAEIIMVVIKQTRSFYLYALSSYSEENMCANCR